MNIQDTLQRIRELLENHPGDSAAWLGSVIELGERDQVEFYRALNSKRVWGGVGSIACEALADNPGINAHAWRSQIREFRELMVELGAFLQARGRVNPDMGSWLLAFGNWNQSQI